MRKVSLLLIIVASSFASIAHAQTAINTYSKKIAFINGLYFSDEKHGVKKLVKAQALALSAGYLPSDVSIEKRKQILDKRDEEFVKPIEKEMSRLIEQIERQNDLTIFNLADLEKTKQIIWFSDDLDLTVRVIDLINQYFEMDSTPLLTLFIPESKIAVIDSAVFFDEKQGISKITNKIKTNKNGIQTNKNQPVTPTGDDFFADASNAILISDVSKEITAYAQKKRFNIILDSKNKLPDELRNFQTVDVTKDFISYYNQLNP